MEGLSSVGVNNEEGPELTYRAMSGPTNNLQTLIKYVYETSGLNLETDKSVLAMLDLLTRHLPRLSDINSRLRAIGSYGLTYAYLDGFTLDALDKAVLSLDRFREEFPVTVANALPGQAGADLSAQLKKLDDGFKVERQFVDSKVLMATTFDMGWQDYFENMTQQIGQQQVFADKLLAMLEQRIDDKKSALWNSTFQVILILVAL